MQSCSIHHCVLLLLTLTFTTAPVADAVCPVFPTQAKLHQPVTLPCTHKCSAEAKWKLYNNRDVVFARCDQTSCSSVVKGYEMSHDQYKKGDLSLTITSAEYSMRNTYVCECGTSDYSTVRLSIETVFSAVQKNPGEDLILNLTVPEPVEVIYTSSDSADGEQICNVTQHSLQCKAEYTHRTSLRYPELTLRDVMYSDSGRYTIRDTENKEDIRVYAVSVTGLSKGMTALIVLLVLVLVLVISGVIIYKWREAEKKRRAAEQMRRVAEVEEYRKVENEERAVYVHMDQLFILLHYENHRKDMELIEKNPEEVESKREELEKKMEEVEKMIDDLEQRYRENSKYKEDVGLFCKRKRRDLEVCRKLSKTIQSALEHKTMQNESLLYSLGQLKMTIMMMERVLKYLDVLWHSKTLPLRSFPYTQVDVCLKDIKSRCKRKIDELDIVKKNHSDEANVKFINDMKILLSALEMWCEEKDKELQKYTDHAASTERSENQSESEPLNSNV